MQENDEAFKKILRDNNELICRKVVIVMSLDLTLQQIAEGIPKTILNASDKDLEGFQKIIDETIKLREGHRNLQKMIKSFSSTMIQRS
jgi:hypothetical protein